MLVLLCAYILSAPFNVASFLTLCSISHVPSDKFQSALCYDASSVWQSSYLLLHSKMQYRQFHYAIYIYLIFYVPSNKFQSALCYAACTMWQSRLCYVGPSLVLHSKTQCSMPLVVVYNAMFTRPILVLGHMHIKEFQRTLCYICSSMLPHHKV